MNLLAKRNDIIRQLQKEVLGLQGYKRPGSAAPVSHGLGAIEYAFPDRVFPLGAMHEFISHSAEDIAATTGFVTALLSKTVAQQKMCVWVSSKRILFPPALKVFGIEPHRVLFIDLLRPKDVLWTIEEALSCQAVGAVVGDMRELTFTESRRLQLAVEKSGVTGFIHRHYPRKENTVACVSRWKIKQAPGLCEDGLPGVGLPSWQVQLVKVRNGRPGSWHIAWVANGFKYSAAKTYAITDLQTAKAS
jgi:protein ImuA